MTLLTARRGVVVDRHAEDGGVLVILDGKVLSLHPDVIVRATPAAS